MEFFDVVLKLILEQDGTNAAIICIVLILFAIILYAIKAFFKQMKNTYFLGCIILISAFIIPCCVLCLNKVSVKMQDATNNQDNSIQEKLPDWVGDDSLVEIIGPLNSQKSIESPISVVAVDKLALRTGPDLNYVELYTLPETTSIVAFEKEEGDGAMWLLLEYTFNGQVCRGYTTTKRISLKSPNDVIPSANHDNQPAYCITDGIVYAAPSSNAAKRATASKGDIVTILDYDGIYAYIDFHDKTQNARSRGYILSIELSD